ncbi:hypothetical protein [Romboutsia sp.]|uniref:hypothetical protein n=1 Tax=Romboutsia sp. TaxID=1965302 RepID=UPI003F2F4E6A
MRKNKTIAFTLAAMISVGAGALGTKGLFTDKETETNKFTITIGDLDVKSEVTKEWYVKSAGDKNIEGQPISEVNNKLQPGDVLAKDIKISNIGSLNQEIIITAGNRTSVDGFIVDDTDFRNIKRISAGNNEIATITLTLDSTMVDDKYNMKGEQANHTIDLDNIVGTYTIDAKQADTQK